MHIWGDEWFEINGDKLYTAEQYIYIRLKQTTKCKLISKEKYGTIRYEHIIPPYGTICFFRNKYQRYWCNSFLYKRWEKWAWKRLIKIVKEAVRKWPELKHELTEDLNWRFTND